MRPRACLRISVARKPFNSQSLIYHLTHSNECGNLQTKVLLTVSPFRPFLLPQPLVFSRAPYCKFFRMRSLAPNSLEGYGKCARNPFRFRSYKNAPSASQSRRFAGPLFSSPYKSLFPQLPSFHIGVSPSGVSSKTSPPLCLGPVSQTLCSQRLAASLCLFALFSALVPFVFKRLQPLLPKYRGGGFDSPSAFGPQMRFGMPEWVYGTCQPSATMLKSTRHLYEHP